MKTQNDATKKFKLGDVIRNVKPYWGEATLTIKKRSNRGFYCAPGSDKRGPCFNIMSGLHDMSYSQFISEDCNNFNYEICSKKMRLWLWFLGQTYGRVWRYFYYK